MRDMLGRARSARPVLSCRRTGKLARLGAPFIPDAMPAESYLELVIREMQRTKIMADRAITQQLAGSNWQSLTIPLGGSAAFD